MVDISSAMVVMAEAWIKIVMEDIAIALLEAQPEPDTMVAQLCISERKLVLKTTVLLAVVVEVAVVGGTLPLGVRPAFLAAQARDMILVHLEAMDVMEPGSEE